MTAHQETKHHPLCFWAIVAEDPLLHELTILKQQAADRFGSQHALRSPAHITLIQPIRLSPEKLALTSPIIQKIAGELNPFRVHLNGVSGFPPRVVYVDVVPHSELNALQYELRKAFQEYQLIKATSQSSFHPHVTLAFRDLSEDRYDEALHFFDQMDLNFMWSVQCITRLRHHANGWQIEESVDLKPI